MNILAANLPMAHNLLAAPAVSGTTITRWASFVLLMFGLGLSLFFFKGRYGDSLPFAILSTILAMGAFSAFMLATNWSWTGQFGNWLISIVNLPQGSPIAGLVLVAVAIIIVRINIPYVPETVERGATGIIYFLGGFVMTGSSAWAALLTQVGAPIIDIAKAIGHSALIVVALINLFLVAVGQPPIAFK